MSATAVLRAVGRIVAGAAVFAVLIVAGVFVRGYQVAGHDDRDRVDAIVVLGAAQYNGRPSPVLQARLDHARALYDAGVAPRIVTIGGNKIGDRTTEGAAGAAYLADQLGLAASNEVLTAVPTGNDTLTSLRAAATVLDARGWTRVVLVTDPAHAFRAQRTAQDLGLDAGVSSVTEGPAVEADVQWRYHLRETAGLLFYLVLGGSSGSTDSVL